MPSIRDPAGGVLPLTEAIERFPERGVVLYNRVSSWGQAGPGKVDLVAKTDPLITEVRKTTSGRRMWAIVQGVEEGKLSEPRPHLSRAAKTAAQREAILVAADLSRLIRSEAYDRRTNAEARPTDEEFAQLRALTLGVPLATVADPLLTESERHSRATKRTGKAGRPTKLPADMEAEVFAELEFFAFDGFGRPRYGRRLSDVASDFGISPQTILRAMQRPCSLLPGGTWRDWLLAEAEKQGWLEVQHTEHGTQIEIKVMAPLPKRGWWRKRGRPPKLFRGR